MSAPLVIGIDPGKRSAVVALRGSEVLYAAPVPLLPGKGKRYDVPGMVRTLKRLNPGPGFQRPLVVIERQKAMPGQGRTSMFTIGQGFGLWQGVVAGLGFPYDFATPTVWTKAMGCPGKDKGLRFEVCGRLLPTLDMVHGTEESGRRVKHDGIADAALLALWGQRRLSGR